MQDLTIYTVIGDRTNERYQLAANWNPLKKKYYMPSLDLLELRKKASSLEVFWDNERYLMENLLHTLKEALDNKKITEDFENILQHIPYEDFKEVREMLENGIGMGFFKEYFDERD